MRGVYLIDIDFAFNSGLIISGIAFLVLVYMIIKRKFFKRK
jgi:hypothetical protein